MWIPHLPNILPQANRPRKWRLSWRKKETWNRIIERSMTDPWDSQLLELLELLVPHLSLENAVAHSIFKNDPHYSALAAERSSSSRSSAPLELSHLALIHWFAEYYPVVIYPDTYMYTYIIIYLAWIIHIQNFPVVVIFYPVVRRER